MALQSIALQPNLPARDLIKPAAIKPNISYEEFSKLDIRVGTIEKIGDVEKSKKPVPDGVRAG